MVEAVFGVLLRPSAILLVLIDIFYATAFRQTLVKAIANILRYFYRFHAPFGLFVFHHHHSTLKTFKRNTSISVVYAMLNDKGFAGPLINPAWHLQIRPEFAGVHVGCAFSTSGIPLTPKSRSSSS